MLKKEVKKNMAVKFVRRNGQVGMGVVSALPEVKTNGTWVEVNTGDKKNPVIAKVRLEKLERADAAPAAAPVAAPKSKLESKVAKAVEQAVKTKPGLKTLPPVAHTTLQPEAKWPFPGVKPGAAADALAATKKPIAVPKKTPAKSAAKPAAKGAAKKK